MNLDLERRQAELASVCRRLGVSRLMLFGSVVDGGFDPGKSDLDFAVEFFDMEPVAHKRAYFELRRELEALFDRDVDLVEPVAVSNPYLRRSIESSQKVVYAAA